MPDPNWPEGDVRWLVHTPAELASQFVQLRLPGGNDLGLILDEPLLIGNLSAEVLESGQRGSLRTRCTSAETSNGGEYGGVGQSSSVIHENEHKFMSTRAVDGMGVYVLSSASVARNDDYTDCDAETSCT